MGEPIRLQKILAAAGFGSRRGCETFITEGRVSVDGAIVSELGAKADIESQSVELDGRKIAGPGKLSKSMRDADERVYYVLNKPKGTLCTNEDPAGRPVAVNMIPEKRRIFCVGRLDLDTEGLIILTNDGDLTNRLTHPRYGVPKTYLARVEGEFNSAQMHKLQTGMHLAEGRTQGAKVRVRRKEGRHCVLEITISEGMNRQVRRMLARIDLKCRSLTRIAIGPVKLGDLNSGEFRKLTTDELDRLNTAINEAEAAGKAPKASAVRNQESGVKSPKSEFKSPKFDDKKPHVDRADKNAFARPKHADAFDDDEEEFEDDDGEDAFAAASAIASKSKDAPLSKRRVIDTDDDEVEIDEAGDTADANETSLSDDDDLTPEELAEIEALNAKLIESEEADEEPVDQEELEALSDEKSTEEAVEAMDESRPWEKVKAKTGKAWADRGDTIHDPELVAAGAEAARENERIRKERVYSQTDGFREPRDRGVASYTGEKRGPRPDRFERRTEDRRPARSGAPDSRGGKPWEKRGPARPFDRKSSDRKPVDGERRPREYGDRKGHTPRPWEKTAGERAGGFKKPGGYDRSSGEPRGERKPWVKREGAGDRGGSSDRPRSYSKPGGYDRSSGEPRGERKPWVKREGAGSSDRPRTYSKPGGFDRSGGDSRGERKPWVKREGGSSDRPRSFSKPGGYDRGGSDRPKPYGKPGGYDRSSSDSRGERKPWVKREGGGDRPRDNRDRPARTDSSSRSRPWENARPQSGERSEGGGQSIRPWEKKRE